MATKILLRRGTANAWTSNNTILDQGEVGIETDTFKFKIGNGSNAWNTLQYAVTANVISVNGQSGTVSLTTSDISEGSNQYFTNARARTALSVAGAGSYDNSTGVITITGGVTSVGGATGAISNIQLASSISNTGILTTANIVELTNLYFTNSRVYTNVLELSYITAAALNGYATNSQLTSYALTTSLTTDNVSELSNLYFTNTRVYSNVIQLGYITSSSLSGYATNNQLTSYATTTHVNSELANLVNSAPATLDTLNELALALGNDASFATTITNLIGQKAGTNSLTTANVVELTNLYYTNARVYAAVTGNLDTKANIVDLTTANVAENNFYLYFTNARARTAITVTGNATYDSTTGVINVFGGGGADIFGYINSTISAFPSGDYGDLTPCFDSFGAFFFNVFDCMEPKGSLVTTDLEAF